MKRTVALRTLLPGALLVAMAACHNTTPPLEAAAGPVVEVPQALLARIRADLLSRVGDGQSVVLNRAESVTWPSGALGCPVPGMTYTQALVPGYRVVFEADGRHWDYRASDRGAFRLCDSAASPRKSVSP